MAPAPVSVDGDVAGKPTDIVVVLEPDADPATPGRALAVGETLRIALPPALARNAEAAIPEDTNAALVLTKGWPQGAIEIGTRYRIAYDAGAHAIDVTARESISSDGTTAPGIKAIHLRGKTFVNPAAGTYTITVERRDPSGVVATRWEGGLEIRDRVPTGRLAPTNFHVPPGTNSNFQTLAPGQVAPLRLGLLLWGADGSALDHVGIAPRDLSRYPRYTGGLLVQDVNGDRRLDVGVDRVVGGIIGSAPEGAKGQAATSPVRPDGTPILSGEITRDAGYPMGGGQPNPGLLAIEFRAGDRPGSYRPTFELEGGAAFQFTIRVAAPTAD